MEKYRWKKIPEAEFNQVESFLRGREIFCMNACSRFLSGIFNRGHVWRITDVNGNMAAFLFNSRRSLFPIFTGGRNFPLPRFLDRFLLKIPVYSVQGLREDTEVLESGMLKRGYTNTDRIDYDIMTLDREPLAGCFGKGPPGLVIRVPGRADADELFALHSAYEKEEVIPVGGSFDPDNCRKTIERLMSAEQMLVACLGGIIVGKINTNAKSFTRFQIGGVYVRPEFRGHGIAEKMSAIFARELIAQGRGVSLFVKKRNAAARRIYCNLGFTIRGDYRISYY